MKILSILSIALLLFVACDGSKKSAKNEELVWVKTDPVQCLGNPWEKDWLEKNDAAYEEYPKGHPRKVEPEESEIIRSYFEELGINVNAVDYESYPDDAMVCEACSCPQGYTLFIEVSKNDMEAMKELDFTIATEKNEGQK